jgi:hypothetical protein
MKHQTLCLCVCVKNGDGQGGLNAKTRRRKARHSHAHAKMSENKIPSPLATNEKPVVNLEFRSNARVEATMMKAIKIQRIAIIGRESLMTGLWGTSRMEAKHMTRASAPVMPIVILDAVMPQAACSLTPLALFFAIRQSWHSPALASMCPFASS